jgi:hypothetical protein
MCQRAVSRAVAQTCYTSAQLLVGNTNGVPNLFEAFSDKDPTSDVRLCDPAYSLRFRVPHSLALLLRPDSQRSPGASCQDHRSVRTLVPVQETVAMAVEQGRFVRRRARRCRARSSSGLCATTSWRVPARRPGIWSWPNPQRDNVGRLGLRRSHRAGARLHRVGVVTLATAKCAAPCGPALARRHRLATRPAPVTRAVARRRQVGAMSAPCGGRRPADYPPPGSVRAGVSLASAPT